MGGLTLREREGGFPGRQFAKKKRKREKDKETKRRDESRKIWQ